MSDDSQTAPSSDLSDALLDAHLHSRAYGRSRTIVAETGSTMDDARAAEESGAPDGHTVVADTQSAGRGSRGRTWHSPAGVDLYFSVVVRPQLTAEAWPLLTLAVGVGVGEALRRALGDQARAALKWPNDVLLDGKKCAGILVETRSTSGTVPDTAIVGVGVNVNRREFPEGDYELPPTSVALIGGSQIDRAALLASVLEAIERAVDVLRTQGPAATVAAVNERLAYRDQQVRWEGGIGSVVRVAADGSLVLRGVAGETSLRAGRVMPVP